MIVISILLFSLLKAVTANKTVSSCGSVLSLECREGEMMVVHEAAFTPHSGDTGQCERLLLEGQTDGERHNNRDILKSVVRKCSGVRSGRCTFDLRTELAESVSWGGGRIDLGYSCQAGVLSYCGGRVSVSGEGFISSPGYPRYYLGGRECVWTIQAEQGQRIELEVVDLALRDTGEQCEDSVQVREEGLTLMSLCGDLEGRADVASTSRQVELRMRTAASKQSLYPDRGLLLHYAVRGCPTPGPIAEGRVKVSEDGRSAEVECEAEHVVQSSLTQASRLTCDNTTWTWSPPVSHCISVKFLIQYANQSVVKFLTGGRALQLRNSEERFSTEFELELVATVLVGVLLLVSAVIAIFILYRFRKSQDSQEERIKLNEETQVDTSITEMGRY